MAEAQAPRPWPVVLLTALGAWLAAIPLIGAVGLLLGDLLAIRGAAYAVGALPVAAAVVVLRDRQMPLFVEQLALPALLAGFATLGVALQRDFSQQAAAAVLCGLALAIALPLPQAWLRTLLGALAAALAVLMLVPEGSWPGSARSWLALHLVAAAGSAGLLLQRTVSAAGAGVLRPITGGWVAVALAGLGWWSGLTILVGGVVTPGVTGELAGAFFGRGTGDALRHSVSAVLALLAAFTLARAWPTLRRPLAVLAMLVLAALAAFLPALGAVLLVLALLAVARRWALAGLAALTAAWIVGSFYYQLAWPLATKALVLVSAGAALGMAAWFALRGSATIEAQVQKRPALGIAACALATLAVVNHAIWQKERLIAHGDKVFVALAPVDPRSLVQGDFMRLAYRLPRGLPAASSRGKRPSVVAQRDPRGVAQLLRIDRGEPLAAGEFRIELTPAHGGWTVVSDAWFFPEGEGARLEGARFAEIRVDGDGRALLVGLADAQLRPLANLP